jgi:hypothetical protein
MIAETTAPSRLAQVPKGEIVTGKGGVVPVVTALRFVPAARQPAKNVESAFVHHARVRRRTITRLFEKPPPRVISQATLSRRSDETAFVFRLLTGIVWVDVRGHSMPQRLVGHF